MNKDLLNIYSDYLISQNSYATATGLSAMLNGEISHDQVSRFLRAESYGSKELWGYVKPEIHRHEQATGSVLLLDDTISEKNYTDENAVNCWAFFACQAPSCQRYQLTFLPHSLGGYRATYRL